jgi:hypothetical protein
MKTSVKAATAVGAVAILGGLAFTGASLADRGGFGGHGGMHFRMMGGVGHQMLADVDTDSDGALSQEEIDAAIDQRFGEFDANTDQTLSLEEFKALWASITEPAAVRAFQFLDPNGDASVARAELDERFGAVVSRFDHNDDGLLSPDDRRGRHGRWHDHDDDDREEER